MEPNLAKLTEAVTGLTQKVVDLLDADNWTLRSLATADEKTLTQYPGIGKVLAGKIIKESQTLVNELGMKESRFADLQAYQSTSTPETSVVEKSVRVRRIEESQS